MYTELGKGLSQFYNWFWVALIVLPAVGEMNAHDDDDDGHNHHHHVFVEYLK